ncbi:uncharacterized protein SPAPADRAFT_141978 [Spathaspora passalidarum NRRL Y-27907]|uniref:Uncharacterized protein n=1 Tax=Spathaspora passalidarum (strain NRRL Y-27907 / 11-Y1) TaxID=619300 RepID=G3AS59_SPAPN|nr:uncharacterized protein SPAPADRAFT_141978 [Spathaspora passalidarum NRRL Y-27907]EGW31018.1 hypothetical protein SPAPADRAFT_141978 [Spathaspora passalidarum NRRL Y-27907]
MRSLPPPRITRARRWKRIKRAIKNLFLQGYISDFSVFHRSTQPNYTISKIHKSRFSSRLKKQSQMGIIQTANIGLQVAGYLGKLAANLSFARFQEVQQTTE